MTEKPTQLDEIQADVAHLKLVVASLIDLLRSALKMPPRGQPNRIVAAGVFTPPADLGPAIAALSEQARQRMYELLDGRAPTPEAIAEAADWWNEQRRVA